MTWIQVYTNYYCEYFSSVIWLIIHKIVGFLWNFL